MFGIFGNYHPESRSSQVMAVMMWLLGILGFAVIGLVLLGWLPFGERANISRRDINIIEILVVIGAFFYALSAFQAGLGLGQRKREGLRWGQWVSFTTMFLGGAIIFSVIVPALLKQWLLNGEGIDLHTLQSGATLSIGESNTFLGLSIEQIGALGNLLAGLGVAGFAFLGIVGLLNFAAPDLLRLPILLLSLIPGAERPLERSGLLLKEFFARFNRRTNMPNLRLLLFLFGLAVLFGAALDIFASAYLINEYESAVSKIRHPAYQHLIPGFLFLIVGWFGYRSLHEEEVESDELRRAVALSPVKSIRSQLAKSPSAGAIIGAMAIFFFFSVASDIFLDQSSIASFLSNISTKGIMAIGVTMLMISGEFDLSVGSMLGVAALSFLAFMTDGAPLLGVLQPLEAALLSLVVVAILGAINGTLLIFTRIPSFIVTLGTMLAFRAITLVAIAGGRILRYSDYHEFLPNWVIQGYVFVALSLVGIALLLYTAYRALPVMLAGLWRSGQQLRANIDRDAGPGEAFRSVDVLFRAVSLLVVTLVLAIFVAWLGIVAGYHLTSEDGQVVEVGFFDITNGRLVNHCLVDEEQVASGEAVLERRGRLLEGECSVERIMDGEEVLLRGQTRAVGETVSNGLIGWDVDTRANYRLSIIWWLFFVVVFHLLLTRTSYGNRVFAVGGNPGASRAQGVNVDRVKLRNFIILALLTGIAGIYEVARNPGVDPLKGEGFELEVIAMTVIGGTLLSGGYGSIIGSMLGALIVGMLQTGLVLVGIPSRLFAGTVGVTIIVAVVLNTFVRGGARD